MLVTTTKNVYHPGSEDEWTEYLVRCDWLDGRLSVFQHGKYFTLLTDSFDALNSEDVARCIALFTVVQQLMAGAKEDN